MADVEALPIVMHIEGDDQSARQPSFLETFLADRGGAEEQIGRSLSVATPSSASHAVVAGACLAGPQAARRGRDCM